MKRLFILFSLFMGLALSQPVWAYKEVDLEKLLKTNSCPGCDLSGAVLNRANLEGANLHRAHLSNANLLKANLTHTNLSRANLFDANLREANVKGATFCTTTMPDGTINNSGC